MKAHLTLATATLCLLGLATGGCGKEDADAIPTTANQPSAGPAAKDGQSAVGTVADQTKQAADRVAADAKATADKMATDATATADAAGKQAQDAIAKAKALIDEKKYPEALTALQQLSNLQLTPEQQKLVDDLKTAVQKLIADNTAKGVGGLPEPKK